MTCKRIAVTVTSDMGIVFKDPNVSLLHPVTQTHECSGLHTTIAGLIIHHCECGTTFYVLGEALNKLVVMSPDLAALISKAIKDGKGDEPKE